MLRGLLDWKNLYRNHRCTSGREVVWFKYFSTTTTDILLTVGHFLIFILVPVLLIFPLTIRPYLLITLPIIF